MARLRDTWLWMTMMVALAAASSSLASSNFPGEVASQLGGEARPPLCTVCHQSNAGGFGTVTTPHGVAMVQAGLIAGNLASLRVALNALRDDGIDSDGGGVSDVDELTAGGDPNDGSDDQGGGGSTPEPLQYGFCAATKTQAHGVMSALGLGVMWQLLRRSRRNRAQRRGERS
jgi:hypothetical protein